ncbi:MAG: TonB family protein, partial [Acidobacteriota bacterium]|nr:TonB family protein [Acidobacteriota bacterium]
RVTIVPLKALGVPEPRPAPPKKPAPKKPEVKAEPEKKESEPTSDLPSPEAAKASRQPEPSARERTPVEPTAPPETELSQRLGGPDGSSLGTTPFGAQAGVDDPDFRYDYYIEQMLVIIGGKWLRPSVSGVEVIVHFRIARDGRLDEIEITRPSGSASFDIAGLRAVELSSPLPPLPASYPHPSLGVSLLIR